MKQLSGSFLKIGKFSQIKFGETFAIMIIVFFAFIFGAQFYVSSLESSFQESQIQRQDTQALERLQFTLNYQPFLKSTSNVQERIFNELFIEAFKELDNTTKNRIFRESEITITLYDTQFNSTSQRIEFVPAVDRTRVIHNNTQRFFNSDGNPVEGITILPHVAVINVYDPVSRTTRVGILRVRSFFIR